MAGEGDQVDAERGDVERHVRRGLGGVEHGERPDRPRRLDQAGDGGDGAQHVGLVGEGHDLGALGEQGVEVAEVEREVVGDRDPAQRGAGAAGELLPGHQVRVVLHLGDEDLVTLAHPQALRGGGVAVPERARREVQRLGGVAGEDHLVRRGGAEELRHPLPCPFVGVGRRTGHAVRAALDRGVVVGQVGDLRVDHLLRPLRGGPAVEVDHRGVVIEHAGQDREVRADRLDVELSAGCTHRRGSSFARARSGPRRMRSGPVVTAPPV